MEKGTIRKIKGKSRHHHVKKTGTVQMVETCVDCLIQRLLRTEKVLQITIHRPRKGREKDFRVLSRMEKV